jgi:hypothetical protein
VQPPTILVISDPPHGAVKEEAAAAIMGLPAAEARPKIAFGAPEVLAATNADRAADIAESLASAGLNVAVRRAAELADIPWATLVSSFEFTGGALVVLTSGGRVELPYGEPAFAVACRPSVDFRPPEPVDVSAVQGRTAAESVEWIAHLDLYSVSAGKLSRVCIAPERARASGPDGRAAGTATAADLSGLLAECRGRFSRLEVDARLDGLRPRRRFVPGEAGFDPDVRKRYAFGTLLLRHLLESISPELRDVTHYELGSRLAYVLQPARGRVRVG